jgi:hypothetical protein
MTIRVLMKINEDTSPELYADLQKVSPRRRGERLRLLATLELREHVVDRDDAMERIASKPGKIKVKTSKKQNETEAAAVEPTKAEVAEKEEVTEHERPKEDAHSELRSSMISGMKNQF